MSKTKQYLFEYICSAEYEEELQRQKYAGSKQLKSTIEGFKAEKQAQSIQVLKQRLKQRFKRF